MSIAERCFEEHDNPAHTIADLEGENADLRAQVERLERDRHHALNLLAVIHRDGGHYTADLGFENSCKSGEAIITQLRQLAEARNIPEPEAFRDAMLQSGAQAEGTLMSEIRGEWYSAEEILAYMVSIGVKIPAIEKDMLSAGIKPKEQETVTMEALQQAYSRAFSDAHPQGWPSTCLAGIAAVLRAAEGKKVIDV